MEHTTQKIKALCFVGGKSAGHITPCLTLAAAARAQSIAPPRVLFFSTRTTLDAALLAHNEHVTTWVPLPFGTQSTKNIYTLPALFVRFLQAVGMSLYFLRIHQPSTIASTGGLVALPVCIAGFLLRIPIVLYECNATPGAAITALAPLATKIYVCFNQTASYFCAKKTEYTNYPIRFDRQALVPPEWDTGNKTVILITGGSQGSIGVNRAIRRWLADHPELHAAVAFVHQTGSNDSTNWRSVYEQYQIQAQVFEYCAHIEHWYARAQVVICRAGAGTLFELLYLQKKALIIPLVADTTCHQRDNARSFAHEHPHLFQTLDEEALAKDPTLFHSALYQHITTK